MQLFGLLGTSTGSTVLNGLQHAYQVDRLPEQGAEGPLLDLSLRMEAATTFTRAGDPSWLPASRAVPEASTASTSPQVAHNDSVQRAEAMLRQAQSDIATATTPPRPQHNTTEKSPAPQHAAPAHSSQQPTIHRKLVCCTNCERKRLALNNGDCVTSHSFALRAHGTLVWNADIDHGLDLFYASQSTSLTCVTCAGAGTPTHHNQELEVTCVTDVTRDCRRLSA